jgi:hypothetical protein
MADRAQPHIALHTIYSYGAIRSGPATGRVHQSGNLPSQSGLGRMGEELLACCNGMFCFHAVLDVMDPANQTLLVLALATRMLRG